MARATRSCLVRFVAALALAGTFTTVSVTAAGTQPGAPARDLSIDERMGGHTLQRHVGRTDADLFDRLDRQPGISAASTYTDRATAERVVGETLARERGRIDRWLNRSGSRPNLTLDYRGPVSAPIGRTVRRGDTRVLPCSDAIVVLRWDSRRNYYVLTSYPERRR